MELFEGITLGFLISLPDPRTSEQQRGTTQYCLGQGTIDHSDRRFYITTPDTSIGDSSGIVRSRTGVIYRKPNFTPHASPPGEDGDTRDFLFVGTHLTKPPVPSLVGRRTFGSPRSPCRAV